MRDDDPITLKVAAADFGVPFGVLKANGISGRLAIYKLRFVREDMAEYERLMTENL